MLGSIILLLALVAIYVFLFRGFFGKHRSKSSSLNPDGPAWGAALLGGFAAASIAEALPGSVDLTLALAAIVGLACALPGRTTPFLSLPAAVLGAAASICTAVRIWVEAPSRGTWVGYVAITACMVLLYLMAEVVRTINLPLSVLVRSRGASSPGERALGQFASLEVASFLLAPGGAGVLDWATSGGWAVVVWLAIILVPILLGAVGRPFITMFTAGVALALLYLSFLGLTDSGFVPTMTYLAASMVTYWVIRWVIRGFSGRGVLSD